MARRVGQGSGWIRREKRLAIYLRDGFQCQYCGRDLKDAPSAEVGLDHLVCSSAGGDNTEANLVTACRACNSQRGTRPWTSYATGGAIQRILGNIEKPLNMDLARAIVAGDLVDGKY